MFVLALSAPAVAQTQRVEGVVRNSAGTAIVGARVTISGGAYQQTVVTDANGKFILPEVPVRSGTITVSGCDTKALQRPWKGEPELAPCRAARSVLLYLHLRDSHHAGHRDPD